MPSQLARNTVTHKRIVFQNVAQCWCFSNPPEELFLNQYRLVLLKVLFHDFDAGKRGPGPFGFVLKELVMNQAFADFFDVEVGVLHFPDLPGLQWFRYSSALLRHKLQTVMECGYSVWQVRSSSLGGNGVG